MSLFPKTSSHTKNTNAISGLELLHYFFLTALILYFGKLLFIPLSFAILVSFILYPVCKRLEKNKIHPVIAIGIALSALFILLIGILSLLIFQAKEFLLEWEPFKSKLLETLYQISTYISKNLNITNTEQISFFENILNHSENQLLSILESSFYSFSHVLYYIIIIPVFTALILYYHKIFINAILVYFPKEQNKKIIEILRETINIYHNFINGMLLVYLIVGIFNSIGLLIIGIPHPFMFGFIAAILTFIPYVGIMISALLPITISWITYNSIWYPIGVISVFAFVQVLEAYIIFPYIVGNKLKINTFAIILMITLGGILWGAAGMILFIPFTSIIKLIADRTESLKAISIFLSDGNEQKIK
ncbi:AI-2E family transporter [Flavobacterium flavipallidum]|uniref:AI-2E family transporter n=1 Tax=Flavobacterium flavipallidum TaxID=3139140 RepID=A0ABU9HKL1_9FLAO